MTTRGVGPVSLSGPAVDIPAASHKYLAVLFTVLLVGCASEAVHNPVSLDRLIRNPVPLEHLLDAEVLDMPDVRAWGDAHSELFQQDLIESIRNELPGLFHNPVDGSFEYAGLALSGGGDHGAFGVGVLKGWSESGTRPVFKVVTGISTGALIAPFALLGSDYDQVVQEAYTTITASDIYREKPLITKFLGEAMADNHPLQHLVHQVVTDEVIDAVGEAHRNGQRLYIGTTNFDAQRPVIWNMGAVANSVHPEAYDVFRKVLIASAAIPILFPPVLIEAEVDGGIYDEMHVDGGTVGQMFFYGATLDWRRVLREVSGEENPVDHSVFYAIVDGEIDPEPMHVERHLMSITERTASTLIKVSAWSSLYRMYLHAQQRGYAFRFIALPDTYEPEVSEPYNQQEMTRMFEIGYELGLAGDAWRSMPPGF